MSRPHPPRNGPPVVVSVASGCVVPVFDGVLSDDAGGVAPQCRGRPPRPLLARRPHHLAHRAHQPSPEPPLTHDAVGSQRRWSDPGRSITMPVSIAKRANGKWRARYRAESGKEHSQRFDRELDAQQWLDQVTSTVLTGTYADPKAGRIVRGVLGRVVGSPGLGSRHHARDVTGGQIHAFVGKPMKQVRRSDVEIWITQMDAQHDEDPYVNVRSVFCAAVRTGWSAPTRPTAYASPVAVARKPPASSSATSTSSAGRSRSPARSSASTAERSTCGHRSTDQSASSTSLAAAAISGPESQRITSVDDRSLRRGTRRRSAQCRSGRPS